MSVPDARIIPPRAPPRLSVGEPTSTQVFAQVLLNPLLLRPADGHDGDRPGHTVPVVDYLDVAIIVFLFLFALSGLRRGLSGVAFSLAGLLAGLFLGAVIAAPPASVIAQAAKGRR